MFKLPCLFQDIHTTSSGGCTFAPGVIGVVMLFRSHMKISDSLAAVANKFDYKIIEILHYIIIIQIK